MIANSNERCNLNNSHFIAKSLNPIKTHYYKLSDSSNPIHESPTSSNLKERKMKKEMVFIILKSNLNCSKTEI